MSNSEVVVSVERISKRYRIGLKEQQRNDLAGTILSGITRPIKNLRKYRSLYSFKEQDDAEEDVIWALQDVSFSIARGEVVGIIGRNGAGKSTLLKVLSRITTPTSGQAMIQGKVGSLLEVGTGFHQELTGRENVYLNGVILGMRKKEVDRKFDEIVEFSGVGKFLDTPVKRYSSGMRVRLAFAVAASLEPEILIIDEVLAVGDADFQKKCLGKMDDVARSGRTVLFVSHNMAAIQALCPRIIYMQGGTVFRDGHAEEVIAEYLSDLREGSKQAFENNPDRRGLGHVRLTAARIRNHLGQPGEHLVAGKAARFEFDYENPGGANNAWLNVIIFNQLGVAVTRFNTRFSGDAITGLNSHGKFICDVPVLPLPLGEYRAAFHVVADGTSADEIPNALVFDVHSSTFFETGQTPSANRSCTCLVAHHWRHEPEAQKHAHIMAG